jgi:hypothetical protein
MMGLEPTTFCMASARGACGCRRLYGELFGAEKVFRTWRKQPLGGLATESYGRPGARPGRLTRGRVRSGIKESEKVSHS